jgi:hypothetical protein
MLAGRASDGCASDFQDAIRNQLTDKEMRHRQLAMTGKTAPW